MEQAPRNNSPVNTPDFFKAPPVNCPIICPVIRMHIIPTTSCAVLAEHWIVGGAILFGFLWLRSRVRALRGDGEASRKAIYGIFLILAPLLLIGKWGFEKLPYGPYVNLSIELLFIVLVFGATGFLFVRKGTENGDTPA